MNRYVSIITYLLSLHFICADERDPKKRRVKPVERHLIQLDFGLSDSEEDSDFEIKDHQDHGKN